MEGGDRRTGVAPDENDLLHQPDNDQLNQPDRLSNYLISVISSSEGSNNDTQDKQIEDTTGEEALQELLDSVMDPEHATAHLLLPPMKFVRLFSKINVTNYTGPAQKLPVTAAYTRDPPTRYQIPCPNQGRGYDFANPRYPNVCINVYSYALGGNIV